LINALPADKMMDVAAELRIIFVISIAQNLLFFNIFRHWITPHKQLCILAFFSIKKLINQSNIFMWRGPAEVSACVTFATRGFFDST